jgi:hypothetical protein
VLLTIFNMMAVAEDVLKVILAIVGIIVLLYVFISKPCPTSPRYSEAALLAPVTQRMSA